jgi:hypothetical protein
MYVYVKTTECNKCYFRISVICWTPWKVNQTLESKWWTFLLFLLKLKRVGFGTLIGYCLEFISESVNVLNVDRTALVGDRPMTWLLSAEDNKNRKSAHEHPRSKRDSSPRSWCSRGRRPYGLSDRLSIFLLLKNQDWRQRKNLWTVWYLCD